MAQNYKLEYKIMADVEQALVSLQRIKKAAEDITKPKTGAYQWFAGKDIDAFKSKMTSMTGSLKGHFSSRQYA